MAHWKELIRRFTHLGQRTRFNRDLEDDGRHMLIVNVSHVARRVFETLGLGDLLRYDRQPA